MNKGEVLGGDLCKLRIALSPLLVAPPPPVQPPQPGADRAAVELRVLLDGARVAVALEAKPIHSAPFAIGRCTEVAGGD